MKWSLRITNIEEEIFTVTLKDTGKTFSLPVQLLPKDSRKGDILNLTINFSPFETLKSIKQAETDV